MKTNLTIKKLSFILISLFFIFLPVLTSAAEEGPGSVVDDTSADYSSTTRSLEGPCTNCFEYKTLVDIPGLTNSEGKVVISPNSLGLFLQTVFNYIIGIAILLTVVMIVYGGVLYATAEAINGKSNAKKIITGALMGLALALGSVLILRTINPDLVKFSLGIDKLTLQGQSTGGTGRLVDLQTGGSGGGTGVAGGGGAPQAGANFTRADNARIVSCPSPLQTIEGYRICPEFHALLKSAAERGGVNLVITQTFRPGGSTPSRSQCHQPTTSSISGSCADVSVSPRTPENFERLCKGLSETAGLFSNNETRIPGCVRYIGRDNTSARTTGAHLHVLYTGGSVGGATSGGNSGGATGGGDGSFGGDPRGARLDGTFENPRLSPGVQAMIDRLRAGQSISRIVVTGTGGSNGTISFFITGSAAAAVTLPVKVGGNGMSEPGRGVSGDKKTPKGRYTLGSGGSRMDGPQRTPIMTRGTANPISMGLGVYNIEPTRSIHLHGTRNDPSEPTSGCVRMRNDDIVGIGPFLRRGIPVEIR
jgi:hypothetical protein